MNTLRGLKVLLLSLAFATTNIALGAGCPGGRVVGPELNKIPTPASAEPYKVTPPVTTPDLTALNVPTVTKPEPIVAKVVWVKGDFKAVDLTKKVRPLTANASVNLHDTLVTDKGGQAQIVFSDYTIMTFAANTKFYIRDYQFDPQKKQGSVGKFTVDLIEGGYRTVTGAIAKNNPSDYQVNTQVATMGVRGTDYGAVFNGCKTYMKFYKGKPYIKNNHGEIDLTEQHPYAQVNSAQTPPIVVAKQPVVFDNTLQLVPATFSLQTNFKVAPPSGGTGGGICAPGGSGGVQINFR